MGRNQDTHKPSSSLNQEEISQGKIPQDKIPQEEKSAPPQNVSSSSPQSTSSSPQSTFPQPFQETVVRQPLRGKKNRTSDGSYGIRPKGKGVSSTPEKPSPKQSFGNGAPIRSIVEEFLPGQTPPPPSHVISQAKQRSEMRNEVYSSVAPTAASSTSVPSSSTHSSHSSEQISPNVPDEDETYSAKTQRIMAWSNLFRAMQPLIWAAVILVVVIPLVGKVLLSYSSPTQVQRTLQPLTEVVVPVIPKRANVDDALVAAIQSAHQSAQSFAESELDDWEIALEGRVDHFLDWYFGYFNQKKMEFMTPLVWISSAAIHTVNSNQMTASEAVITRFTGEFQKQFAKQVLVPQNAQIRLENLTTETVNLYLMTLSRNIDQVQAKYRIPQGQWERYLSDISTTIQDTEGNLSNLSLKMLVGGSGYLLTKPLVLATAGKIGSKVSSKLAGTAAAKLAAKTGGTVAAELGTSLVDPIVGVGIFIWDIWDYHHTVELERPILRANLLEYLQAVEQSLLSDPETGVLSAIAQLEQGIFQSL